jgi:hypothetical protein
MEITELRIAVEFPVLAAATEVWDVLADLPRMASLSPECVRADWLDGARLEPGTRFAATNKMGDWSWDVTGEIVVAARPDTLVWKVHPLNEGTDQPSSTWTYELTQQPDGTTLITHTFAHGEGGSHLVRLTVENPDHAQAIINGRTEMLRANMTTTLTAMADQLGWTVPS